MNYTEKYHLPQWVKSDRIMMKDFNQMCADIESGMTQTARIADTASAAASKLAGDAAYQADVQNGLFRIAYNHHMLLREAMPWQLGMLHHSFAQGEGDVQGMLQRDDFAWMGNNSGTLTLDSMRDTITQISSITTTNDTFAMTFTPSYCGRLTQLTLKGSVNNHVGDAGDCTVRLINLTTGETEAEQRCCFQFKQASTVGNYRLAVNLLLHIGQKYRLEIILDSLSSEPKLSIDTSSACMTLTGYKMAAAAFSQTLQTGETSLGGIVLVRYRSWGSGGTLTLNWDGKTFTPHKVRTVQDEKGRMLQEAEFRRAASVPAVTTMNLSLSCALDGEIELHSIGAALI